MPPLRTSLGFAFLRVIRSRVKLRRRFGAAHLSLTHHLQRAYILTPLLDCFDERHTVQYAASILTDSSRCNIGLHITTAAFASPPSSMSLKLKLSTGKSQSQGNNGEPQSAISRPSPTPSAAGGGGGVPKIKLKNSQPPTPATEQPVSAIGAAQQKKKPTQRRPNDKTAGKAGGSKKRAANEDISPAPKRHGSSAQVDRKLSLKIKLPQAARPDVAAPPTASSVRKLKLSASRKQSVDVRRPTLIARRKVPDRPKGVGYDSEDSEREGDPAIQQGLILRMQPGNDAEILRKAIANGKIGVKEADAVHVSLKFLTNDQRRAVVKIESRMYAAALVDLPCIVESMKSWDKKGWWKVADVHQMLLVLGRVENEDEVKNYPLPREVDKEMMTYAHGLTPPMHYVRKRRFRKRVNYRQMENVEEEVDRLLREDDEWARHAGAQISVKEWTAAEYDRQENQQEEVHQEEYNEEVDADGEIVDTTEDYEQQQDYEQQLADEEETARLEAEMGDAFAQDLWDEATPAASDLVVTDSPAPIADQQATSLTAVENTIPAATDYPSSAANTPAATPVAYTLDLPTPQQEADSSDEDEESDYDEEDEEEEPDVEDEDSKARDAQRKQQLDEMADLEREIAAARVKTGNMTNQLLKRREVEKLGKLEEDLKMKRAAFGLEGED